MKKKSIINLYYTASLTHPITLHVELKILRQLLNYIFSVKHELTYNYILKETVNETVESRKINSLLLP